MPIIINVSPIKAKCHINLYKNTIGYTIGSLLKTTYTYKIYIMWNKEKCVSQLVSLNFLLLVPKKRISFTEVFPISSRHIYKGKVCSIKANLKINFCIQILSMDTNMVFATDMEKTENLASQTLWDVDFRKCLGNADIRLIHALAFLY